MGKKTVHFDYFEVWRNITIGDKVKEIKYDIEAIFKAFESLTVAGTTKDCRSEKARIQSAKYDEINHIWEIQFLRLRESYAPGIADDDGDYQTIKLEDNKYVGEFMSALYDKEKSILVVHRNRNSLTPTALEEYLNKFGENLNIKLKPIISKSDVRASIKGKKFRKFTVGVSTENIEDYKGSSIYNLLEQLNRYEGVNVNIEISLGHASKSRTLNEGLVESAIDALQNNGDTRKLELSTYDDISVEPVDLLSNRVKDRVEFNDISKRNPLEHNNVYYQLQNKYLERKNNNKLYE